MWRCLKLRLYPRCSVFRLYGKFSLYLLDFLRPIDRLLRIVLLIVAFLKDMTRLIGCREQADCFQIFVSSCFWSFVCHFSRCWLDTLLHTFDSHVLFVLEQQLVCWYYRFNFVDRRQPHNGVVRKFDVYDSKANKHCYAFLFFFYLDWKDYRS